MYFVLVDVNLVAITSAVHCMESLVSEMACYVSRGTLHFAGLSELE